MPMLVNDIIHKDDFVSMQQQFSSYIRDPEVTAPDSVDPQRMQIYRELFYNNIENFAATAFPVSKSVCSKTWWRQAVTGFIKCHRCHSPYFHTIAEAFLHYISDIEPESGLPFLHELMHYEWLELALDISTEDPFNSSIHYSYNVMEATPVVSPLALSFTYQYPVHQICSDYKPTQVSEQPTFLLIYRNKDNMVQFIELNAMTASLVEQLQLNVSRTGKELLLELATQLADIELEVVLQFGEQTLKQFLALGILLGSIEHSA